jgi:K+-sensing histidine kinase KdpD
MGTLSMSFKGEFILGIINILVCVTQQKTCERLIRNAALLRDEMKGNLFVIHVVKDNLNFLNNIKEGEALEYLFDISKSVGANLSVLKSDEIALTISDFVLHNKIDCIVLGVSPDDSGSISFVSELKAVVSKKVEFKIVP